MTRHLRMMFVRRNGKAPAKPCAQEIARPLAFGSAGASPSRLQRWWRGFGLAVAIALLTVSTSGLFAQNGTKKKSTGRAVPNSGIVQTGGEEERKQIAPGEPRGLRERLPVEDNAPAEQGVSAFPAGFQPEQLVSPGGLSSTINLLILMTVLSLAPSILIMTTCFIRFVIVMGLLRQALGTQQLPPNQVLISLCLFLTFMVMSPVWQQSYEEGIRPYTNPAEGEAQPTLAQTFDRTVRPIRRYMSEQIEATGNSDTVWLFVDYNKPPEGSEAAKSYHPPETYEDVSLVTLLSAFMLSELKAAFVIGFQIYLPFLVIDMVVATVLMSMGMMMLPPTLVSFPFKLLLFVLIDGWALTVGMMLASVRPSG